ncbi:tetraspanin-8-like [Tasmannia lanceolata]|uniref:tetraspanin-8-like n=1 Tax=Tasmannia lanceolata TaxID=3420 RepID=UPI004062D1B8
MFRVSNNLIGILNFITFLLSIPILGGGIWLSTRGSTDCEKFLDKPIIALGVFLMIVSLAGLIGACCRVSWLLWVYLLVMFLLIVLLFCFTIFAFVVTNKGAGEVVSDRGYKEYRLGDYSNWLQKRVNNNKNWRRIESCLRDGKVCQSLEDSNLPQADFYNKNLSPIQSGCCKPPTSCGFIYVNATVWQNTAAGNTTFADTDCNTWSNDQSTLCYNCQSCKAGVLANLKKDWKKVAIVNIVFLIFLVIVYSIGCCAFRNNREDNAFNAFPRWKGGYA